MSVQLPQTVEHRKLIQPIAIQSLYLPPPSHNDPALLLQTSPTPLLQFKRFRGKINIQRPRAPHYDRALFNAVTAPVYKRPSLVEECAKRHAEPQPSLPANATHPRHALGTAPENPYERIIAREVANWFAHSKFVAIFHLNSISAEDMFAARVQFFKQNMHVKAYNRNVLQMALGETRFANVLPLFDAKSCIVFAPEPRLQQLLRIAKRTPQMVLLAGLIEERLLSRTQLTELAAMPSLDVARAQLVAVLQQAGGNQVVQHLQAHQTQLCGALDAYARGDGDAPKAEEVEAKAETK